MADAWDGRPTSASNWREDCMVALNEADTPEAGADAAADFVLRTLADALSCDDWQVSDGSETWDGDVAGTVYNILRAARVLHPETDEVARHVGAAEVAAREAAAAAAMRMRQCIEAILDAFRRISPEEVLRAREAGEQTEIGNALEAAQTLLEDIADV